MKSVMHEASSIAKAIEQAWVKAGQPQEFSVKILEEPQKNFLGFTTRSAKVALFFDHNKPAHNPAKSGFSGTPREHSREQTREPQREQHRDSHRESYRESREAREIRDTKEAASSNRQKRPSVNQASQALQAPHEQVTSKANPALSQNNSGNNANKRQEKPTPVTAENEALVPKQASPKKEIKLLWSDATTRYTQEWLNSTLESMDCSHIHIAISASTPVMHITLKCKSPEYLHMENTKERRILASIAHLLMDALRQKFKTGFKQHKIVIAPEGESIFIL